MSMKFNRTEFILVKLGELLNKTVELFQSVYGDEVKVMNLNEASEFAPKITNSVVAIIEKSLVFSKKLRK